MDNQKTKKVGVLHPGIMGISVAASIQKSGHEVYWVSDSRREQSRERAEEFNLLDAGTLSELCGLVEVIVSVCPPHAAEEMSTQVINNAYNGTYLDANAISPQRTIKIAEQMESAGISFVDGGIIGVPAWEPGKTWMHLSGKHAGDIAALFEAGPMETSVVGTEPGQASALKMCYAGYNKGNAALVSAIMALAEASGVRDHLETQWENHWPGFSQQTRAKMQNVTVKAWRFTGEMQEIAATLKQAGLPDGFHQAAEEIYERMSHYKDADPKPVLGDILSSLLNDK